jgi:hypothetical protein
MHFYIHEYDVEIEQKLNFIFPAKKIQKTTAIVLEILIILLIKTIKNVK